ncbi:hypothetical protein E3N88_38210 [Mikania micrantha]|uniref:Aminotransferase-like plant mobile domain-containing protein n=1 Tax=Mikania micrantha TaxID=192012 RepID=A0A5N6LTC5_9ASTR|nr:hypothetical protein E3N88_38210 [Mikania micrantha]
MATNYNSDPLVNDLLFLAGSHRADYVFQQPKEIRDGGLLRIRRGDEKLWVYLRQNPIADNVLQYIRLVGFSGVIGCEYRRLDSALISALVERWRPETHTFHMPFGEVTVTLQDVAVLLGLRVDGNVVSVNEDHAQSHNELIGNQRVHVCMLMEHLVTGKPLNVTGNSKNWCVAYRRYMADQIYFWCCLPRPGDV